MVAEVVVWHGTPEGVFELSLAVIHNCDCRPPAACAAHRAMLEQRFLDGVLFVRYLRVRLLVEEFKA